MKAAPQPELAGSSEVFNLACECGDDPSRVLRERLQAASDAAAAREYELRMQRVFSECPGFIGGDAPSGEMSKGFVVVDPARAQEARTWIKRRFHVNQNVELTGEGLRIEVIPRSRRRAGVVVPRVKVSFCKPEQLTMNLAGVSCTGDGQAPNGRTVSPGVRSLSGEIALPPLISAPELK